MTPLAQAADTSVGSPALNLAIFAAFLSTSSGLLVTASGVLAQDLLPSDRTTGLARGSVRRFQLAAAGTGAAALALALLAGTLPLTQVVGLAFAVMVVGSLLTPGTVPADVGRTMLLLHAPDGLDLQDTATDPATVRRP